MRHPDVREAVRDFVASNFLFDDRGALPTDDESLLETGVVDSTGVLDLLMFVEETFGFSVPDDDVIPANFDSIAHLSAYIERRLPDASMAG